MQVGRLWGFVACRTTAGGAAGVIATGWTLRGALISASAATGFVAAAAVCIRIDQAWLDERRGKGELRRSFIKDLWWGLKYGSSDRRQRGQGVRR